MIIFKKLVKNLQSYIGIKFLNLLNIFNTPNFHELSSILNKVNYIIQSKSLGQAKKLYDEKIILQIIIKKPYILANIMVKKKILSQQTFMYQFRL